MVVLVLLAASTRAWKLSEVDRNTMIKVSITATVRFNNFTKYSPCSCFNYFRLPTKKVANSRSRSWVLTTMVYQPVFGKVTLKLLLTSSA